MNTNVYRGSSSAFRSSGEHDCRSMRNTCRPKEQVLVVHLDEKLDRQTQFKSVSKIPIEHKTQEEARAPGYDEDAVCKTLKRLLQDNSTNDKIEEWIRKTLNDKQRSSEGFIRALTRAVCQSVIVDCGVYTLNMRELFQRVSLLKRFIKDDFKQLVALNALQQLVVRIDQPDGLLRMFYDVLLDEEVIQEQVFFKWKSSTADVKSVLNFFTYLQEADKV